MGGVPILHKLGIVDLCVLRTMFEPFLIPVDLILLRLYLIRTSIYVWQLTVIIIEEFSYFFDVFLLDVINIIQF